MKKKVVKKTVLKEKELTKVVGGKKASISGYVGRRLWENLSNIFKHHK